jgi:hypothetical protein
VEEAPRTNRTGLAAAIIGTAVVLFVIAIVLDLGPFADDDLSAAEYLAQGDEVCKQAHDDFLDIQGSSPRTADDAVAQVEALLKVAEDERDAILDLSPPESLAEAVDAYIADRKKGIDTLQEGLGAARDDDPEGYEEAQAKLASQQEARQKVAQKVGFNECSEPLLDEAELERQSQPPSGD